jgi:hypothetical protein
MILTPPQVGKSRLAGELFPFWWLARHHDHNVILASYGAQLAIKRGRATREMVRDHGTIFNLDIDADNRSAPDWQIKRGGGMRSVGVGGSLTGHRGQLMIADDLHKDRAEADSRHIRDGVSDWWSSTFLSRLAPGAPVVLCGTPWHEDDILGRVLATERGKWRVVRLPAFADTPDDPLGRAIGQPLTHPAINDNDDKALRRHWNTKRAESSIRDWGALYQCDPKPVEGALLRIEQVDACVIGIGAELPDPLRRIVAVDPSGGGKDEAGIIAGYLGVDDRLYVTSDESAVLSGLQWAARAAMIAYETQADEIIVETNYGGDMVPPQIRSAWDTLIDDDLLPPRIVEVKARYAKIIRAAPMAQALLEGRIRFIQRFDVLFQQLTEWQESSRESPGRLDALVMAAAGTLRRASGLRLKVTTPVGIDMRSQLLGYQGITMR